ncbi:MAG: hypothetical protein PHO15_00700 [Eubacteriales bacterium]|nr:hypothetical protein [Eubacteriales bacterium]
MPNGTMPPRGTRRPDIRWRRAPRFFPYFYGFPRYRYNCPMDTCPYDRRYDDRIDGRPDGWYGIPRYRDMMVPGDMDEY